MGRVLRRDRGVDRERIAPDERDAFVYQILGRPAGEAWPAFEEAASLRARRPPAVPSVAEKDPIPRLYRAVLGLPRFYAFHAQQIAGPKVGGHDGCGASGEAV